MKKMKGIITIGPKTSEIRELDRPSWTTIPF